MDLLNLRAGTTISPLCTDCGKEVAAFEIDGTAQRLGYGCIAEYVPTTTCLTLGEIERRLEGEQITESELRLLDGNR